jgi:O-antigen ligase
VSSATYKTNNFFTVFAGMFLLTLLPAILFEEYLLLAIPFGLLFFYWAWQNAYSVFLLLIASLPWSIEFNFTPSLGTDLPDEPLMLLVAGLIAAILVYNRNLITVLQLKHPLLVLTAFHLLWIIIAVIFSGDSLLSLKYLLAKCWYILAFVLAPVIFLTNKITIRKTVIAFFVSMLSFVLLAVFRHAQYSFTFATINDALAPFFRNHVNYSAMLVCFVPVAIAMYRLNEKYRKLLLIAGGIILFALFLSFSRGAWLALLTGLAAYWLIKRKLLVTAYVLSIVIVIASLFWIRTDDRYLDFAHDYTTTIFHKDFNEHLIATYKLKDVSTAERFYRWVAGVRMTEDHLLTGYGPNSFYNNYKPYAIPAFKTWVSDNKDRSTVHNYFLLLIVEQGLPGLIIFLILAGAMLFYAQHLYHTLRDNFYKQMAMACGSIVVMLLTVNFLSDLIETDKVGSLFFLCLGLLIVVHRNGFSKTSATDNNS